MKRFFSIVLMLCCLCLFPASARGEDKQLHQACKKILGPNGGAILVYDLKTDAFLAVVNPETAFNQAYKPGSLFKLVTSAALLENGRVNPAAETECLNHFSCRGQNYTCWEPGGHGMKNMAGAIADSCSVYFYKHAQKIAPAELAFTAKKFGCGKSLALSKNARKSLSGSHVLVNAPVQGTCTPPQDPGKFIQFAVGDDPGITMSPWQVMNMTAIVATGKSISPGLPSPQLKPRTLQVMRDGMKIAVQSGTCEVIGKAGIDAAAKTGTSTNYRDKSKYHGWFAGYTPVRNPRYIVVVFLEDGHGYADAVPRGMKVMKLLR